MFGTKNTLKQTLIGTQNLTQEFGTQERINHSLNRSTRKYLTVNAGL